MYKPLKFLFISSDKYIPFRVDVGVLFGRVLSGRGHNIDWILQSEDKCDQDYKTKWHGNEVWVGATNPGTGILARLHKHYLDKKNDFKMVRLIKNKNYDFVQVKDKFISALPALWCARRNNSKFIYWLSYPFPEASICKSKEGSAPYPVFYYLRGLLLKFLLYRIILPRADHVFVQSEQMKKDIMAEGIPGEKLTAVPMGIEPSNFPQFDSTGNIPGTKNKYVTYLGTMIRDRKMEFLICSFSKVLDHVPEAVLFMVGGGNYPSDISFLQNEADRLGISDSVVFTGFLPMKEAWSYVQKAQVCVSPFYPIPILNSTSPTKLVEYMGFGKPVVATNHPEQNLVISQSGAGICVPYDEGAFARGIIEILNDPIRAEHMGRKGKEYVYQNRTYERIANLVEKKYYRIIEQ